MTIQYMALGGKRPGAGRPRGTENDTTKIRRLLRQKLTNLANDHANELFDAKLALAKGHYVQEDLPDGSRKVYLKSPDGKSIEWLLEQTVGKAPQPVEHSGGIEVTELIIDQ